MAEAELGKSIKQTQEMLGKFVKKPPLSEKNLGRPPFRFLHDVTMSVTTSTGFMKGVFDPEELDSNNITSREAKTEFMRKLVAAVNDATGEDVPVKISKILSGQEPENTNLLLQTLARAIEKAANPAKAAKAPIKPKPTESKGVVKLGTDKKSETKSITAKPVVKGMPMKKGTAAAPTPPTKKPPPKTVEIKAKKEEAGSSRTSVRVSAPKQSGSEQGSQERKKSTSEKVNEVVGTDAGKKESSNLEDVLKSDKLQTEANRGSSSSLKRQNSSLSKLGQMDDTDLLKDQNRDEMNDGEGDMIGIESNMHDDSKRSDINSNMETLQLPTSPLVSDASAVKFGFSAVSDQSNINEDTFSSSASVEHKKDTRGALQNDNGSGENAGGQPRIRPGSNRIGISRPPSARPAPPRPKSSMLRDTEESNYRPPMGKVTNVLLDNSDIDEDDNFVVREAAVAHGTLGGVDETPELALATGTDIDVESTLEELAPADRGLLVDQILETQREIENRDGAKKDLGNEFGVGKSRETSKAEIEKVKNLLQECARNANPLGKLLDYVREDIDAMQKEVAKWREESRSLDSDLEAAKRTTEASLQPIQQKLTEVDTRVADKEDAIAATKMSVIRLQERIEKILSGLDRVQSSHGKLSIPSASQLLHSEPAVTQQRDDNHFQRDNDNSYVSGFGSSLNRLAQSTPGMRPISLFSSSPDDLDPDNFDPFKK